MASPSAAETKYLIAHASDNKSALPVDVSFVLAAITTVFVFVRLLVRKLQAVALGPDDYVIVVALVLCWGLAVICFFAARYGLGRHITTISPDTRIKYLQCLFAFEIVYCCCVSSVKISVLLFYRRIFDINRRNHIILYSLGGVIVAWTLARVFSEIFQCSPMSYSWNKHGTGTCINLTALLLSMQVFLILTDLATLAFPIPILWKLHLPTSQKFGLIFVFLLGFIAIIASIVRAVYLRDVVTLDITYSDVSPEIWSLVETCVGTITACLPIIRSAIFGSRTIGSSRSRKKSTGYVREGSWPLKQNPSASGSEYLPDQWDSRSEGRVHAYGHGHGRGLSYDLPLNSIKVQQEVHLSDNRC